MKETIQGTPVTEEQITTWVAEAEAGYDVELLRSRRRGRPGRGSAPSQVVTIRFTPEELAEVDRRAQERHISRSDFIRKAVLA
ncbi:ribbon-helix-helix domain-containing protein [Schaalia sp. Marseille-Q2122]|uniref:ribbon-helix-helix domain-containing protein n=1 Tax=Schaalia sp. Marseille-Q2122 TaxID=2736604 RepID=UPI00158DAF33|nr:ribbon-helix-helix domain-containing protein [Schaalia sp. Marseille-Q2122]